MCVQIILTYSFYYRVQGKENPTLKFSSGYIKPLFDMFFLYLGSLYGKHTEHFSLEYKTERIYYDFKLSSISIYEFNHLWNTSEGIHSLFLVNDNTLFRYITLS